MNTQKVYTQYVVGFEKRFFLTNSRNPIQVTDVNVFASGEQFSKFRGAASYRIVRTKKISRDN